MFNLEKKMNKEINKKEGEEEKKETGREGEEKIEKEELEKIEKEEKGIEELENKEALEKTAKEEELANLPIFFKPVDFRVLDKDRGLGVYLSEYSDSDRNNMTKSIHLGVCAKGGDGTIFDKTIFETDVYSYNAEDRGSYRGIMGSSLKGEGSPGYGEFEPDKQYDRIKDARIVNGELIIKVHAPANQYVNSSERIDTYKFNMDSLEDNDFEFELDQQTKEEGGNSLTYSTAESYESLGLKEKAKVAWKKLAENAMSRDNIFGAAYCYNSADMKEEADEVLLNWADNRVRKSGSGSGFTREVYERTSLTQDEISERIKKLKG